MIQQTRMPRNEDLDKVLPPSPRSPHMMGSPMSSPRAKISPQIRMLKKWPRKDERRMLNVEYCVGNIEESIEYYKECLEMHILRRTDFPEDKHLTVFMGYGYEDNHLAVKLTYNYGVTKYDIGSGLNHFGLAVPNVQATLDEIRKKGFPAPDKTSVDLNGNVCAMLKDPTGYPIKLIQRAFGMFLLARNDHPLQQKTYAYLAYHLDDTMTTVVELEYNYDVTEYNHGTGYVQLAIGTDDVYQTAKSIALQHGRTTRPPGPLPIIPTKICACLDPDGWEVIFADNMDFSREQEPSSFVPRVTTQLELKRGSKNRCPASDTMFTKPPEALI